MGTDYKAILLYGIKVNNDVAKKAGIRENTTYKWSEKHPKSPVEISCIPNDHDSRSYVYINMKRHCFHSEYSGVAPIDIPAFSAEEKASIDEDLNEAAKEIGMEGRSTPRWYLMVHGT